MIYPKADAPRNVSVSIFLSALRERSLRLIPLPDLRLLRSLGAVLHRAIVPSQVQASLIYLIEALLTHTVSPRTPNYFTLTAIEESTTLSLYRFIHLILRLRTGPWIRACLEQARVCTLHRSHNATTRMSSACQQCSIPVCSL